MNVYFEIGKKTKWAIVGAALLLIGWILVAIGHGEDNVVTAVGSVCMVIGGILDVIMLAKAVIQDMEEDNDL